MEIAYSIIKGTKNVMAQRLPTGDLPLAYVAQPEWETESEATTERTTFLLSILGCSADNLFPAIAWEMTGGGVIELHGFIGNYMGS